MSRFNEARLKIQLKVTTNEHSRYWGVTKYYSILDEVEMRERVMEAIKAYWLALALSQYGKASNKLFGFAQSCCHRLQKRIEEIRSEFHVGEEKVIEKIGDNAAEFIFKYQPYINSEQGTLMQYLTDTNEVMSTEHKILSASDGFWAPFAGRELGLSKRQLETQAYWSIEGLKGQIAYLKDYFQLERVATVNSTEMTSPIAPNISPAPTPEPEDPNRMTEEQMWNDPLMDEWGLNAFPDSFMDFDSNDSDK